MCGRIVSWKSVGDPLAVRVVNVVVPITGAETLSGWRHSDSLGLAAPVAVHIWLYQAQTWDIAALANWPGTEPRLLSDIGREPHKRCKIVDPNIINVYLSMRPQ